jgi:hypothetical protein
MIDKVLLTGKVQIIEDDYHIQVPLATLHQRAFGRAARLNAANDPRNTEEGSLQLLENGLDLLKLAVAGRQRLSELLDSAAGALLGNRSFADNIVTKSAVLLERNILNKETYFHQKSKSENLTKETNEPFSFLESLCLR